jgi:Na+-translocating membrane potential-generating system MpsC-like protein
VARTQGPSRLPIKAKTYVLDNLIVCVLSDGFTAIERTMAEGGEPTRVLDMRRDFQRMMKEQLQRHDRAAHRPQGAGLLSQAHIEPGWRRPQARLGTPER